MPQGRGLTFLNIIRYMTVERKRVFADTFSANGNVVSLVAKATAAKPNRSQPLYKQT